MVPASTSIHQGKKFRNLQNNFLLQDAHNIILDFDENTSLFAVYDGHGGAEVASYCSHKLPNYIKDTSAYKTGEMVQALEESFLCFDATITTPEVMTILKELAGKFTL